MQKVRLDTQVQGTLPASSLSLTKSEFDTALSDDDFAFKGVSNIFTESQVIQRSGFGYFHKGVNSLGNEGYNFYEESDGRITSALFDKDGVQTIRFDTNGNSYLNGGNVGIGTTSPSEKLDVNGNTKINGLITAYNSDTDWSDLVSNSLLYSNGTGFSIGHRDSYSGGAWASAMHFNSSGNVSINSTSDLGSKFGVVGLPTSSTGLSTGAFWNNGGVASIA